MTPQYVQNKEMNLVLSSDAKPRLKWTPELHQRFVDAVNQLGGAEKATPKSLMRVMSIHGLTLYHLKSHLQKYRLGRSQQPQPFYQNKLQDNGENQRSQFTNKICHEAQEQINESFQLARTLRMQMEVQRKLHEQTEVQRHLQLRIEAQGKYLQSVFRKAQETLAGCFSNSIEVEHAKDQLSQLVLMVDSRCPSSPFSELTESDGSVIRDANKRLLGLNGYSLESSLTSSESSGRKKQTQPEHAVDGNFKHGSNNSNGGKRNSVMFSVMEMHPSESESENQASNRKRRKSTKQSTSAKSREQNSDEQALRHRALEGIDLNCNPCMTFDSGPKVIDLNFKEVELLNGTFSVEKRH